MGFYGVIAILISFIRRMKYSVISIVLSLYIMVLGISCKSDDEELVDQKCYRCIYPENIQTNCDSMLIYEACVIRPHESSLQMIMEITEKCNE